MNEQIIVFVTLVVVLIMFAWGRWRYDVVAVIALLIVTISGIIPYEEAFYGFSHPAVITVAAVLIISRALMNSGIVDLASRKLSAVNTNQIVRLAYLVGGVALCSAFMNNVGALALFMPVAIRMAKKSEQSPSTLLMPLAFGSLLGGLITQVGTPPNIIISMFRADTAAASSFRMFDFAPVGLGVTIVGVIFIVLAGWRLIPCRIGKLAAEDLFSIDSYLTEVVIPAGSSYAGKRLLDLGQATTGDVTIVGHVRNQQKLPFLSPYRFFQEEDHIIIKANAEDLQEFLDVTGLQLTATKKLSKEDLSSDEITIAEVVITAGSVMEKQTARSLELRSIYGINLLGISREGTRLSERPDRVHFRSGDVLLLQGRREALSEVMSTLGCLPLVERGLQIGKPRRIYSGALIFVAAILMATFGFLPIQIAFTAAAVAMLLIGLISLRELYDSIEWPIVVLLGAMFPLSRALETTGGANTIGEAIYQLSGSLAPGLLLVLLITLTMLLSNIVNNAAAALLMAPVALSLAGSMGVSADPLLMTVAVGASCAFMTPIGHQSNTLVMGPGGYHFGDYWRMGLPLTLLVALTAVPLIMLFWPLGL